jgi:hypothetical protein
MSSDGAVHVQKASSTAQYWGKYQTPLALAAGIYIAGKLYAERPKSYESIFSSPDQFEIEHFIIDADGNGGDCTVTIDLDTETIFFDWGTFIEAMQGDGEIESARTWFNKLKPFCQKVPKEFEKRFQETSSVYDLAELIEEYELVDEGFVVPLINIESFKELGF